jgi:hypothetical protein
VGDDEEGPARFLLGGDEKLVEVGDADRVQTRVRLVEEHDLGFGHHRPGQPSPLLHAARHLTGELLEVVHQADQFRVPVDQLADRRLVLAGVLAQREGNVVVEVHRTE